MPPALLLVGVYEREMRERSWWRIPRCLRLVLMLMGKEKAGSLMWILLD